MKRILAIVFFITALGLGSAFAQQDDEAVRLQTRDRLAQLLEKNGAGINVSFTQSTKQPFN